MPRNPPGPKTRHEGGRECISLVMGLPNAPTAPCMVTGPLTHGGSPALTAPPHTHTMHLLVLPARRLALGTDTLDQPQLLLHALHAAQLRLRPALLLRLEPLAGRGLSQEVPVSEATLVRDKQGRQHSGFGGQPGKGYTEAGESPA